MTLLQNTYVMLDETEDYIKKHYRSNNSNRVRWDAIADEDKKVLLISACAEIDLLPFNGRKAFIGQKLAFPRLPLQYGNTSNAPDKIKAAQIELALWLTDETTQEEIAKRSQLQAQGLEGFSIGDLSESYTNVKNKPMALQCVKAARLLTPYLGGGYATC